MLVAGGTNGISLASAELYQEAPTAATLTLAPTSATNPVGTQHCVTATVKDASGTAVPSVTVRFKVTGSVNTGGSAPTNTSGQATFCYTGPALPGQDAITAYADTNGNNTQDAGEPSGAATKTWVLPATTPNCDVTITEAGSITANNGDVAKFTGNAHSSASGATSGQETYTDMAANLDVKSINVQAIVCESNQSASIYGQATINGSGSFDYRIRVKDLGLPPKRGGTSPDTYWILISNGYNSGEHTLQTGNVQITIHRAPPPH